jgi:hypothetical protein
MHTAETRITYFILLYKNGITISDELRIEYRIQMKPKYNDIIPHILSSPKYVSFFAVFAANRTKT